MRDSLRSKGQRREMNKKRTEMKLLPMQDNNDIITKARVSG